MSGWSRGRRGNSGLRALPLPGRARNRQSGFGSVRHNQKILDRNSKYLYGNCGKRLLYPESRASRAKFIIRKSADASPLSVLSLNPSRA